jgi:hypothetical protein
MLCDYGCGKEATHYFKTVDKWCCSESQMKCDAQRKKYSESIKGRIPWNKNKKGIFSKETLEKISKATTRNNIGKHKSLETRRKISIGNSKPKQSEEFKEQQRQRMLNGQALKMIKCIKNSSSEGLKKAWKDPNSIFNSIEHRDKRRQVMLNGGAIKALRGMKKISKPEMMLRDMVKELYPESEPQYPVFNYVIDVALPNQKIAIEYDGYFHFCDEGRKQYHKLRQEKIESEGWKFYRVTMFDKFPDIEEVKINIQRLIND